MERKVILVVGRGPLSRMPPEIDNDDTLIRCVTNDSVDRIRGLHPDMLIVKDEYLSERLSEEVEHIKPWCDTVIDLRE